MNNTKLSGVVLDFNGTMVWDTKFHLQAWLDFAEELGHPLTPESYYRDIHGKTTKHILEMLSGHAVDEQEIARLSAEKERLYREACLREPETFILAPGVADFFDYLVEAAIPRTIATASERVNVDFFIDYFALDTWFKTDLFAYDDGTVANKPEPDIYLKAASLLQLEPSKLMVVEDSYYGVLSARAAGAGCLVVTGPSSDQHTELRSLQGIDRFITDFKEIDRSFFS